MPGWTPFAWKARAAMDRRASAEAERTLAVSEFGSPHCLKPLALFDEAA